MGWSIFSTKRKERKLAFREMKFSVLRCDLKKKILRRVNPMSNEKKTKRQ